MWGAGVRGRVGPWLGLHLSRNHVVYVEKSLHVCGCGRARVGSVEDLKISLSRAGVEEERSQ